MRRVLAMVLLLLVMPAPLAAREEKGVVLTVPDGNGAGFPIRVYAAGPHRPLAVILPGIGLEPGDYGFVRRELVRLGFAVAMIQPVRPGDPPTPAGGDAALVRRPSWLLQAARVTAAVDLLLHNRVAANRRILLVGHSNGGDVAMLLATERASRVSAVFSLDNRRMPMPRVSRPRICSVRSSDQPADPGVLPTERERREFGMRMVMVAGLRHDDMWDGATADQRSTMLSVLRRCLRSSNTRKARVHQALAMWMDAAP